MLDQLTLESIRVTPNSTSLIGFAGDIIMPKGITTLPILLGKTPHKAIYMVNFFFCGR